MDPALVQRDVEDDVIPVASVYPASVNEALCLPRALMDFRASSSPYRFAGLKGPWKFTGSEDAGPDRFAINIARPPSQPLASTPAFDFLPSGRGRWVCSHPIRVAARQQCPQHSRVLVGQGHRRHVGPASQLKSTQPDATRVAFALDHASASACAVDEQRAQVTIAALADAK
jgi:hypothetical protein